MLELLPGINAALNAISLSLIVAAFVAIRRGRRERHQQLMLAAIGCSALFLVGYLTRVALTGTHRFPDVGTVRTLYMVILFSHMVLAVLVVPLVLAAVVLGLRGRFDAHRKVVRFAWPIWVYVSLTGVIVYVMLYHVAPGLA